MKKRLNCFFGEKFDSYREKAWFQLGLAILINVLIFGVTMLVFEPTPKSDDYDMCNILYGGVNGEYSQFILYENIILGYILKFLLQIWPGISWYYILQYMLMILAFSLILYVFLIKFGVKLAAFLFGTLMVFSAYEFYVRITFSKTSGILLVAGLLGILYAIEERKRFLYYIVGLFFVFCGILYRSAMLELVLCIFFGTFIFNIIKIVKSENKNCIKLIIQFTTLVLFCMGMAYGADKIQVYSFDSDSLWGDYRSYNTARAGLMDLGWPDYNEHSSEYERIGVSNNDYQMWKNLANIADPEKFSYENIKSIQEIKTIPQKESFVRTFSTATKGLIYYLVSNTMFIAFVACAVVLVGINRKASGKKVAVIFGLCTFAYYYLYFFGRLQHHVDAVISFAGGVILLYYCERKNMQIRKIILPVSLIFLYAINYFYTDITQSSYYGSDYGNIVSQKEQFRENHERMLLFSEDNAHLYLLGAYETNVSYHCFSTYEVIEKGFYHNIFRLNQYTVPVFRAPLENYEVDNPFAEIVNSDVIYYAATEACNSHLDIILQYIRENYNKDAYYSLVKYIDGFFIYRFNEGSLAVDLSNVNKNSKEVISSIDTVRGENGITYISGYAYIEGVDSYSQNMYIEVKNRLSGKSSFYYTLQMENGEFADLDKYQGKYSSFSANIEIQDEDFKVYLVLENSRGIFRLPIELNEEKNEEITENK